MPNTSDRYGISVPEIAEQLRGEIVSGALPPEQALRQEELAERFGVSRMPVREAIKALAALGLVVLEDNRRAKVAPISRADFLEIYDMRVAVETLAITSAIPHLTNLQIESAAALQSKIETAPAEEFGPLNTRFHMTLYAPSARPRLLSLIETLCAAADRYMFMCKADAALHAKSNTEHHELLAACTARNETAAADCLRRHIGDARDIFVQQFES